MRVRTDGGTDKRTDARENGFLYLFHAMLYDDLFAMRDLQLFKSTCRPDHCLHHLLPPIKTVRYSLRDTGQSSTDCP